MKRTFLMLTLGSAALFAVGTPQTQAAFTLLDNFNSYDNTADTRTSLATGGVWQSEFDNGGGDVTGNSNVVGTDQGQSLETLGGTPWRGAKRDLTGTDAAVLVGEVQTYFWQVQPSDPGGVGEPGVGGFFDFMMGLSPSVDNIDTTDAWQDFAVMPFVDNAANTPFIAAVDPVNPFWWPLVAGEWHNVWVVIDNDAVTPTYDVYVSAGTDAPILVAEDAFWRGSESGIAPGSDLNAIGFMAAGATGSRLLIDNIHYAPGEDLSNPVPEPASLALMGLGGLAMMRRR